MRTSHRVLIVEDDPNALSGYVEFLAAAGFAPTGLTNADEALPLALSDPPAAVVTDITLPGMNGFEFASAIRSDSRTRGVPIIGLTAHWTTDVHSRARDVAMQVMLSKPCMPAHLVAELERVLGRAKALDEVSAPRAARMGLTPDVHDQRVFRAFPAR